MFSCLGVGAALPLDACAMNSSSRVLSWRAGARLVTGGDPCSRVPPRDPRIFWCVLYVVLRHRGSMHRKFNAEWLLRFLLTDGAALVVSIDLEALEHPKPAAKSLTISVIPVAPPLESEEVEALWLLAL